MKAAFTFLKKILPWVFTGLIFFYLFRQCPPEQMWQALKYMELSWFVGLAVLYFLAVFLLDTLSLSIIFNQFQLPVRFSQLLPARVVSYLLAIVNYFAGQASLAFFLKKTQHTSFFKNLGLILLVTLVDLYWVVMLGVLGSRSIHLQMNFRWLGTVSVENALHALGLIFLIGLIIHLAFWRQWVSRFLRLKIRIQFFDWLRGKHLFQTFHHATVLDYLKIAALRLPLHLTVIFGYYLSMIPFHLEVSLSKVLSLAPPAILIGTLPITPGGLGTVQLMTVNFFKSEVSHPLFATGELRPEQILFTLSLIWMLANYVLKALGGLFFLKRLGKEQFGDGTVMKE